MDEASWEDATVSVVTVRHLPLPYPEEAWCRSARSALDQDGSVHELIVADTGPKALERTAPDVLPGLENRERVRHLATGYASRAAALRAGIEAAKGAYVLLIVNDDAAVFLRRSAVRTMLMAATRQRDVGMVYADYEFPSLSGHITTRNLLDYHAGRLRETFDTGRVWLCNAATLRDVGGPDPADGQADLYSLRLRISERSKVVHVGGAASGALYTVPTPASEHDVFKYLTADRKTQRDYESALSQHLRRVGAFLEPAHPTDTIEYTPQEERAFKRCVVSVVIPVNHRPEFIGRAIESVLAQTLRNIEVIVVVNGGTEDPTCAAVERFLSRGDRYMPDAPEVRLLVVDVNNIGMCLNVGLAAARGKYYVQLDSDDRLKPDAVAKLLTVFESDPAIAMVIGSYEVWELDPSSGNVARRADLPTVVHDEWTDENGPNNLLRINGAGAPRSAHVKAIKEVGWFGVNDSPQTRNYGEDYDLVLRISERYRIGRVWEPIYEVVRHPGGTDHAIDQITIDRNDNAKDLMRLVALRRRQRLNRQWGQSGPGSTSQCHPVRTAQF